MVDWPGPQPQGVRLANEIFLDSNFQTDLEWVKLGPSWGLKPCTRTSRCERRQLQLSQELQRKGRGGMEPTKQGPEGGSCRELGTLHSPKAGAVAPGGEDLFSWRTRVWSLFCGLSFHSGNVSVVSIDFGKNT